MDFGRKLSCRNTEMGRLILKYGHYR
jgi:hypothetical protein